MEFVEKEIDCIFNEDKIKMERGALEGRLAVIRQRKKSKYLWAICLSICLIFSLSVIFCYYYVYEEFNLATIIFSFGFCAIFGLFMVFYIKIMYETRENNIKIRLSEIDALFAQKDVEEDVFENSIKMSYKYLDQYYLQTKEQAQRGFIVTVGVAIFGAILIGGGILAMFFGATNPSYVTCATGVITEFIAAVFFYLYNKTISSMSKYHNKLVLSQSISIALKVSESLPDEEKITSKKLIITELMKDINQHLVKDDTDSNKT